MPAARADVDLTAISHNVEALKAYAPASMFMAVVKADGYGHGMVPIARASVEAGVDYLGVALPSEAMSLRRAGLSTSMLAWLYTPGDDLVGCILHDVELSVASLPMLEHVVLAGRAAGRRAKLHLKIDTGMGRSGCSPQDWPALLEESQRQQAAGALEVVGVWSHLACADVPGSDETAQQAAAFEAALGVVEAAGIEPRIRHLANSAGIVAHPATHYDLVRAGISLYGYPPIPGQMTPDSVGLRIAMTVQTSVVEVRDQPDGPVAVLPVGFADGVPRAGSGVLPVLIAGQRHIVSAVHMDETLVPLESVEVAAGAEVQMFGDGGVSADDWAAACGTISNEVITRLGARIPRSYR